MKKKIDEKTIAELVSAVCEYNSLRDDEWDFQDNHGHPDFWDDEASDEHEKLIDDILDSRRKVRDLLVKVTGDCNISF